jgi:uncharacterized damage-inducible protein DinB
MDMLDNFTRLFTYDRWANRETITALKIAPSPPDRAVKLMAHIIAAKSVWLDRLQPGDKSQSVWPDISLDQLESTADRIEDAWRKYLGRLTPDSLVQETAYTNTKGERWSSRTQDVLQHVIMHSAYHRGQVAAELRGAGSNPPFTDFIHAARQGILSKLVDD